MRFPIPEKAGYEKFRNPASRYAMVGVFVAKTRRGVRVAVTGAGSSGVFRAERDGGGAGRELLGRRDQGRSRSDAGEHASPTCTATPTIAPISSA